MRKILVYVRGFSQYFHLPLHIGFGVLAVSLVASRTDIFTYKDLLFAGVLGALLPDLEHFLYFYKTGAQSPYSHIVRGYIKKKKVKNLYTFVSKYHKGLSGLYLHNVFTPLVAIIFGAKYLNQGHFLMAAFLGGVASHFIFDILEDLLFFGKLNPNWYLKFNKTWHGVNDIENEEALAKSKA